MASVAMNNSNPYQPNDTGRARLRGLRKRCIGNCKAGDAECLPLTCR